MVFSSLPAYLDPANWQQQPNHQTGSSGLSVQFPPPPLPPPPPPPQPQPHGSGSIRPGSMADRARMANIPLPEAALKCPRCESSNTKFCYFNNYSLTQPRHFCKTCRRYWTRGGALRNVPVGGGCRRNKRSKGSSSKSPSGDHHHHHHNQTSANSTSTMSSNSGAPDILGLTSPLPPLRFMAPLQHLTHDFGAAVGLNYGSISTPIGGTSDLNFHIGNSTLSGGGGMAHGGGSSLLSAGGMEQWRMQNSQQFPFFGGIEPSPGLFPFEGGVDPSGFIGSSSQIRPKALNSGGSQQSGVKMEENQEMNLSRQFLGLAGNNEQFWGGNAWTDLSTFSSSSTSNPL